MKQIDELMKQKQLLWALKKRNLLSIQRLKVEVFVCQKTITFAKKKLIKMMGSKCNPFQVIQSDPTWSPSWRSLNLWKGHLSIPKGSQRIARFVVFNFSLGGTFIARKSWLKLVKLVLRSPSDTQFDAQASYEDVDHEFRINGRSTHWNKRSYIQALWWKALIL